jgi:HK97 gp10 family phage protein
VSVKFFEYRGASTKGQIADLFRAYRDLPGSLARKHLKAAMRRAIKPFHPALRANTPKDTGNLRRSIQTILRFKDRANWGGHVVGVVGFGRKGKRKGYHSHLLELGTAERKTRNGARRGSGPSREMVRRTLNENRQGIASNLAKELAVSLERAARELEVGRAKGRFRGY